MWSFALCEADAAPVWADLCQGLLGVSIPLQIPSMRHTAAEPCSLLVWSLFHTSHPWFCVFSCGSWGLQNILLPASDISESFKWVYVNKTGDSGDFLPLHCWCLIPEVPCLLRSADDAIRLPVVAKSFFPRLWCCCIRAKVDDPK